MKVSIIIPVYNVEKYIDECILSAINQTLDDIEIIAIDDKSTDSSLDILNKYKEKYDFVKVIASEKNMGLSATRNIGIRNAKGEYIYFLDSDDYIHPNAMEICYEKAKEYDLDIATFDAEVFRDKEYVGCSFNESYDRDEIIEPECIKGEDFFLKYSTTGGYKQLTMLNFHKRDFLIQNNLFFYEGIIGEDELHSFQAFLLAQKVLYIPKKLYFRRIRNNSIMTSADYRKRFECTEVTIREMCKFYLNNKDLFKLDTLDSMKNYIKFLFDISLIFCDRGNLIDDKKRMIETFNIDEMIFPKKLIIEDEISDKEPNNKKNILFVMYLLLDGGAEKALMTMLDNLDYSKYNVDLVVLAKEKSYLYNINENVNVTYMYDTADEMYSEYLNGNFNLELKKEYDIEIGFLGIFTTWVICRFGNPNAKKITWLHSDFGCAVNGNSVDYVTDLYGRMDNIISVSDGVSQSFIDFVGDSLNSKLQRIYVPVDTSQIRKLSLEDIEYKKSKFTIMSIGRLEVEKGFDRLIRVHKRLIDEGIDNELIILGSGGDEEKLRKLVKDLGLEDSCKLVGYQKNPYPWIKMSDVFVSSSYSEALPLAIIDAMVLEKPIVATDTHGSRALFKDKLGMMVSNNEDGLYYGLRLMILNKDIRDLYTRNLEKVDKFDFDKSIVMPEIETLFDGEDLIDDKGRVIETFNEDEEIHLEESVIKDESKDGENDNKKNILFLMYNLFDGGAEKSLMTILDNLDYSKYNVDLVVLAKEKSYLYNINENVNVTYVYDTVRELEQDYYVNGNFNLELKKEYDVEIGFLFIFTTWAICRFGNPNAKKITWLHGDFGYSVNGNSVEYVKDIYGRMDSIISVSDGVSQSFRDFLGDSLNSKLQRIYNPTDIYQIRKLSQEDIGYKKNKFTVMSIGRLEIDKGYERLIRVHKRLIDEGIDHDLILLGNGGAEEYLKKLVKDLGLENSCKFFDYQKNPYPWIKMCDVFVSPSYSEALPYVIIEAMVLEKPIVATDTHGSRALFKDKLGMMVSNSEDGLCYGLRLMILNQGIRDLYTKNLKEVEKFDFDKSIVMPEIEKLFDGGKE